MINKIELHDITRDNWLECASIECTDEQKVYFPIPVIGWMARAKYEDDVKEKAIYVDNNLVGFCVYGIEPETDYPWIISIIIDKKYQNKGYGKAGIMLLISLLKSISSHKEIYICHRFENKHAEHVYKSIGFIETIKTIDNEKILVYIY